VALLQRWYSNKLSVSVELFVDLSDLYMATNDTAPSEFLIRYIC
jgi:hypothetical protein